MLMAAADPNLSVNGIKCQLSVYWWWELTGPDGDNPLPTAGAPHSARWFIVKEKCVFWEGQGRVGRGGWCVLYVCGVVGQPEVATEHQHAPRYQYWSHSSHVSLPAPDVGSNCSWNVEQRLKAELSGEEKTDFMVHF